MRMALRELRRRPKSFLVPVSILALLALLLLYPSSILDGIVRETTAAVRNAPAEVVVYSRDANGVMPRSNIDPALRAKVDEVPGTASVATFDVLVMTGMFDGSDTPVGLAVTASSEPLNAPVPGPNEAIADQSLIERVGGNLAVGSKVLVGPYKVPLTITGFTSGSNLWFSNGLLVDKSTQLSLTCQPPVCDPAVLPKPEAAGSQALLVTVDGGAKPEAVASSIDAATGKATLSMTRDKAVKTMPGIAEQEVVFGYMRFITILVALVVVALFLSFMTLERAPLYAAMKAIGASSRQLFGAVVLQVITITMVAISVAALFTFSLTRLPSRMPTVMAPGRLVETTFALGFTALLGACLSLRRVVGVDAKDALS